MGYIESKDHLINFLRKAIREHPKRVDEDKLLSTDFYISQIYERDLSDKLTWEIRQNGPSVLEEDNILDWLSQGSQRISHLEHHDYQHNLTNQFINLAEESEFTSGCYAFFSESGRPLYVGRSKKLGRRIISSIDRFRNEYDRDVYASIITKGNAADAAILEVWLINQMNPAYNTADHFEAKPSVTLRPVPEWTEPILALKKESQ